MLKLTSSRASQHSSVTAKHCKRDATTTVEQTTLNNSPKPIHSGLMCWKHRSNAIVYKRRTKDNAFSFDASSRLCKQALVNLYNIFKPRKPNRFTIKWLYWDHSSLLCHPATYWGEPTRKTSLLASTVAAITVDRDHFDDKRKTTKWDRKGW